MTLAQWLKAQLEELVNVQRCILNRKPSAGARTREPDVTVYMWTGVHIHIYILLEEQKPRTLKQIIQGDTGLGISSLFIVAPHLLPPDNQVLTPPEWLADIHALTNDRVYSYQVVDTGFELFQVHFENTGMLDECKVIYSRSFGVHQLRYSRVTVKPRAVKGFWMMADFGLDPFWRQDSGRYQPPPRPQYGQQRAKQTNQQKNSQQQSQNRARQEPPPQQSQLELSYTLLGIDMSATQEEVKSAFRRMAFAVHPDVSDLEKAEAEARFKALSEAYEYIKATRRW
ncbi:MAG: J domain-containing protein [Anaerolineae bacterium]|nr:J domain-containing protein [Anaerolineae bacterium]